MSKQLKTAHSVHSQLSRLTPRPTCRKPEYRTKYAYDKIGQLTSANSSVPSEYCGYTYDGAWNLFQRTNNGVLSMFSVDSKNQLTSANGLTCTYDLNGNLTQVGSPTSVGVMVYSYDDENRLTQVYTNYNSPTGPVAGAVWETDFVYDGLGRMRERVEYANGVLQGTTLYIYDGWRVIQERDGTGTPVASFTRGSDLSGTLEGAGGIGGLLARSDTYSGGNWLTHNYYFADGNGNITYLVDSSQGLAASYRYDPFGNVITNSGPMYALNRYRFSSKEIHVGSGMYYYGFRFYDPGLQRWITRDPLGDRAVLAYARWRSENNSAPAEYWEDSNLYRCAGNNPVEWVDYYGLSFWGRVGNGLSGGLAGAGSGFVTGLVVGALVGELGGPAGFAGGAAGGAFGGAIWGGVSGFIRGALTDPDFKPLPSAGRGAICGIEAGIAAGIGAGIGAGTGGEGGGGPSAGVSTPEPDLPPVNPNN